MASSPGSSPVSMKMRVGVSAAVVVVGFASLAVFACASPVKDVTEGETGAGPETGTAPSAAPEEPPEPSRTADAGAATDAGADAPGAFTGPGAATSGGAGGLVCVSHQLVSGRSICVTRVNGLEVKILAPAAGSGAMRLGVHLHGDGAVSHEGGSVFRPMIAWADALRGLGISVLAPNGCSWWQKPTHDCASSQREPDVAGLNAPRLVEVIDAVMKAYDIRTDGLRYYGASGGSIFLTEAWIPLEGAGYPGVFALMCGGEDSARPYTWDLANPSLRSKNPLWFTYGDQDDLLAQIQASVSDYRVKGFGVTEKVLPNAGHCTFDAHSEAVGIWSANP